MHIFSGRRIYKEEVYNFTNLLSRRLACFINQYSKMLLVMLVKIEKTER